MLILSEICFEKKNHRDKLKLKSQNEKNVNSPEQRLRVPSVTNDREFDSNENDDIFQWNSCIGSQLHHQGHLFSIPNSE